MRGTSRRTATLAALLVLVIACGESRQAKLFRELEAECDAAAANGWTLKQAEIAFHEADVTNYPQVLLNQSDIGTLPQPDTCGTASATSPVGQVFWEWAATDSSLCDPAGGCCLICEVRVKKSDLDAHAPSPADAPICASRAAQGQVCQLF